MFYIQHYSINFHLHFYKKNHQLMLVHILDSLYAINNSLNNLSYFLFVHHLYYKNFFHKIHFLFSQNIFHSNIEENYLLGKNQFYFFY